jgi:DNA-binding NarL/FixJ family response regulator
MDDTTELIRALAQQVMTVVKQSLGRVPDPPTVTNLAWIETALRPTSPPQAFPELTEHEREILELIAQHHTNVEIAERLSLAPKTVRTHVSNIFTKLQVIDRAQAIIRAREAGLGQG